MKVTTIILTAIMMHSGLLMATEEPAFTLIKQSESFEVRLYAPRIIAETAVSGNMKKASSSGFKAIANFIFGNNRDPGSGQAESISMTAPVILQSSSVDAFAASNAASDGSEQAWEVSFFMPSQYNLESLPKPNNSAVKVRSLPASYAAVMRFSGFSGAGKVAENTRALQQWIQQQELSILGTAQLARYNPPWTLPFMRRNEIIIEVAAPKLAATENAAP
ncbi:MAG: heme-binding protein [Halioglobus sp.]|nr:heme-binding protein [Halioglobus sp.]